MATKADCDNVGFTTTICHINTHTHACIIIHTYLHTQHRWVAETFTTDHALYEHLKLPAIIMLSKAKLNIFIVAKKRKKKKVQSLNLLQRTSLTTHILCNKAVIMQPSTRQLECHKRSCRHTCTETHNNTPFLCTAVLGSGNTGEQRYLSPKDCGRGRSAEDVFVHSCDVPVNFGCVLQR